MTSALSDSLKTTLLMLLILFLISFESASAAVCEYSIVDGRKLYNYSLATPTRDFPHGILSEDGFYKVAANDTILWFQLCGGMIFNHDSPACFGCLDCGGSLLCGMGCSGLVSNNIEGYPVCTTVGRNSDFEIVLLDAQNPHKGVIVKMASSHPANCSLSVSVICNLDGVKGPHSLQKLGDCDYASILHHPAGCATVVSVHGRGWGWFGTLLAILFLGLGVYLLAGGVYRYFILGIRGIEVVPNLELWTSLPHRTQSLFTSLVQRFRGPTYHHRSTYSPVNF